MAEKLVTRELGSRWVPHPASGTASPQNESPSPLAGRRNATAAAARAFSPLQAPLQGPLPARASRRTRERETRPSGARGHGAGRSPRGRFPPPPQPPPPLTPGTRPGPRGRHWVTQPRRGAARVGGGGAAGARSAGGGGPGKGPQRVPGQPGRRAVWPSAPFPRSAPLLRRPDSVTGISFQHGGQEAAPRGGENIPASPARRRTGQGAGLRRGPRGRTAGSGRPRWAFRGGNDPRDDGVPVSFPPTHTPRRQTPRPQVGSGRRVSEDASSTQPRSAPPASGSRDTTRLGMDSLGLNYIHLGGIFFFF